VLDLHLEDIELLGGKPLFAIDEMRLGRVLSNQSALFQDRDVVSEATLLSEGLDIAHQLMAGNSSERVADPIEHFVSAQCFLTSAKTIVGTPVQKNGRKK
jgi:hypothetical protein